MNIILMRGLPGAGKTSWVQMNGDIPRIVCSADDFHMVDGVYRYDPKRISEAHDWCFKKYLHYAQLGEKGFLIVDNTNTTMVEIAPYARVASALKIPFKIVYIYCDPLVAHLRGTHGVPFSTMLKMHKALMNEEVPPWWPQEIILK